MTDIRNFPRSITCDLDCIHRQPAPARIPRRGAEAGVAGEWNLVASQTDQLPVIDEQSLRIISIRRDPSQPYLCQQVTISANPPSWQTKTH